MFYTYHQKKKAEISVVSLSCLDELNIAVGTGVLFQATGQEIEQSPRGVPKPDMSIFENPVKNSKVQCFTDFQSYPTRRARLRSKRMSWQTAFMFSYPRLFANFG